MSLNDAFTDTNIPMGTMYKNAIFDVDGTIINSYKDVSCGICFALKTLGFEVPDDRILKRFIGPTVYESMTTILSLNDAQAKEVIRVYRKKYEEMNHEGTVLYEGFPELLINLKNAGVKMTLASTKPERFIREIFKKLKIDMFFEKFVGADEGKTASDKTELIEKARIDKSAVMIGDRKYDITAAKKAGVDSIGVTYGFMEENEFELFKPTFIAHNTEEIFNIITKGYKK